MADTETTQQVDSEPGGFLGSAARLRRAILAVTVFLTPVVFLWDVTEDPFNVPKLAVLVTGVALAGGLRAAETLLGRSLEGRARILVPAAFVAVPLTIAWLFSPYKGWSLLGQYTRYEGLVPMLVIVALGVLVADAFPRRSITPVLCLTASGALVALYLMLQSVGLDPLQIPVLEFAPSTIGHSNFAGGFLAIVFPIAGAVWLGGLQGAAWARPATILIGLGVIFSGSQGAWAAAAAGAAVALGVFLAPRWKHAARAGAVAATILTVVLVGLVVYSYARPTTSWISGTTRARGLWWEMAIDMAADSPVVGRGPNTFALEAAHHRSVADDLAHGSSITDHPHSVFFAYLSGAGLIGAAGFLLLAGWSIRAAARAKQGSPLAVGLSAGLIAYLVQSMVSLDEVTLAFALWATAGSLVSLEIEPAPVRPAGSLGRRIGAGVCLVLPLLALWWSVRSVRADIAVDSGLAAFREGRVEEGIEDLESALNLRDVAHYRVLLAEATGRAAIRAGDEALWSQSLGEFGSVAHLPDVRIMTVRANLMHDWSPVDPSAELEALAIVQRALGFDQHHPDLRTLEAEILLILGRPDEAAAAMAEMIEVMEAHPLYASQYPKIWAVHAIARFELGDRTGARASLATAEASGTASDCHVMIARLLLSGADEAPPTLRVCPRSLIQLLPDELRPE